MMDDWEVLRIVIMTDSSLMAGKRLNVRVQDRPRRSFSFRRRLVAIDDIIHKLMMAAVPTRRPIVMPMRSSSAHHVDCWRSGGMLLVVYCFL